VPATSVPGLAASSPSAPSKVSEAKSPAVDAKTDAKSEAKSEAKTDTKADAKTAAKPDAKADPKASADPLGDLAKAKVAASEAEVFSFWVQVGSFRTAEDAESQRAKLSLSGIETKISERELSGKPVFRVRVGPFEKKEDADKAKEKMDKAGLETALVRVQR
jgi:cell division protein FtsN